MVQFPVRELGQVFSGLVGTRLKASRLAALAAARRASSASAAASCSWKLRSMMAGSSQRFDSGRACEKGGACLGLPVHSLIKTRLATLEPSEIRKLPDI